LRDRISFLCAKFFGVAIVPADSAPIELLVSWLTRSISFFRNQTGPPLVFFALVRFFHTFECVLGFGIVSIPFSSAGVALIQESIKDRSSSRQNSSFQSTNFVLHNKTS
jgi:hypothetical protein